MHNSNGKRSSMHTEKNKPISLLGRMLNKYPLFNKISCHAELYYISVCSIFLRNSALHIYGIQSTAASIGEDAVSVKVAVKLNT